MLLFELCLVLHWGATALVCVCVTGEGGVACVNVVRCQVRGGSVAVYLLAAVREVTL